MTTAVRVSRQTHPNLHNCLLSLHAEHARRELDYDHEFQVLDFVWQLSEIEHAAGQLTPLEIEELVEGQTRAEEIAFRSVWLMALHYILQQEFHNHVDL